MAESVVVAAEAAARPVDIEEGRHTVVEEEGYERRFERRWNRSSCEEEGRFEDVAAGLGELRIEAAVAGPAAGLVVAHIAVAVGVESAAGHTAGQLVVVRIVAVVVVGIVAVVVAAGEERDKKEWMIWAVAWQTSRQIEEEEDSVFLAVGRLEEMGRRTWSGSEVPTWEEEGSCVERELWLPSVSIVPSAFQPPQCLLIQGRETCLEHTSSTRCSGRGYYAG